MKKIFLAAILLCGAIMANAAIKGVNVDYTVDGKEYQGYLAYSDDVNEPRPGVLVFPEWWGLTEYPKMRARELAQLGYIAFVADMYGKGVTTASADTAGKLAGQFYGDFKNFEKMTNAGLEQLLKQPNVDPARIAAIGFCFGGTAALELARNGADVRGVVAFHGGLTSPDASRAKNIKGRVLALNAGDDPFSPPADVEAFEKEMKEGGVNYKNVMYPTAKHAFTNPKADSYGLDGVAYSEEAEKASMNEMRVFLSEIFSKQTEEKKE